MDSLTAVLKTLPDDTQKVKTLVLLAREHALGISKEGIDVANRAVELSEKLNWEFGKGISLMQLGRIYWRFGETKTALKHHFAAREIWIKSGRKDKLAGIEMMIGQDYGDGGDYLNALKYLESSLALFEKMKDHDNMAVSYGIIAWIYENLGMPAKSYEYTAKCLPIYQETGNKGGLAITMGNMASYLSAQGKHREALKVYLENDSVFTLPDEQVNYALNMLSIGSSYFDLGQLDKAHASYLECLERAKPVNDFAIFGNVYQSLARLESRRNNLPAAIKELERALEAYRKINSFRLCISVYAEMAQLQVKLHRYADAKKNLDLALDYLSGSSVFYRNMYYQSRYILDSAMGNWNQAFENHKRFVATRDSMFNEESSKHMVQVQLQQEYDKREALFNIEKQKSKAELASKNSELRSNRILQITLYSGIFALLIVAGIIYNRFSTTRKQNLLIEEQKAKLEEKQTEILDSIKYARRIQQAVMNNEHYIKQQLTRLKG